MGNQKPIASGAVGHQEVIGTEELMGTGSE